MITADSVQSLNPEILQIILTILHFIQSVKKYKFDVKFKIHRFWLLPLIIFQPEKSHSSPSSLPILYPMQINDLKIHWHPSSLTNSYLIWAK